MSFIVILLLFLYLRVSLILRMAALSTVVKQTEVRRASAGTCFSLGLRAQVLIDCIGALLHSYVIVQ